jgi:hypothetical protein
MVTTGEGRGIQKSMDPSEAWLLHIFGEEQSVMETPGTAETPAALRV